MAERSQPLAYHKYIIQCDLVGIGYDAGDLAALAGRDHSRGRAGEDLEGQPHAIDLDCGCIRLDLVYRVLSKGLKLKAAIADDRGFGFDNPELPWQELSDCCNCRAIQSQEHIIQYI